MLVVLLFLLMLVLLAILCFACSQSIIGGCHFSKILLKLVICNLFLDAIETYGAATVPVLLPETLLPADRKLQA